MKVIKGNLRYVVEDTKSAVFGSIQIQKRYFFFWWEPFDFLIYRKSRDVMEVIDEDYKIVCS